MKVLLIGYHNPYYLTITEYIEKAITALGQELFVLDEGNHLLPGRIRQRVNWLESLDRRQFEDRILAIARDVKPEIVLASGGDRVRPQTLQTLRSMGVPTVLWTTDAPARFEPILEAAPHYDHVFCQGTEAVEILKAIGIATARWLPMACSPEHHRPVALTAEEKADYGHDVAFVGSHYPVRETLLEGLSGLDLAIWGPGWEKLRNGSPLRPLVRGAHTPPAIWRKIYSASAIVLAPHFRDPEGRFPVYQASPRIFEVLACGAFMITDRQPDLLSLFRDGEHLIMAEGAEELRDKVKDYLARPSARRAIAEKGRQEVLSCHTYMHRLRELFAAVSGNPRAAGDSAENRRAEATGEPR